MPVEPGCCACGQLLHYNDPALRGEIDALVAEVGENVVVTVGLRHWLVQRHYIALHGLKADELPGLGFPEIGPSEYILRQ